MLLLSTALLLGSIWGWVGGGGGMVLIYLVCQGLLTPSPSSNSGSYFKVKFINRSHSRWSWYFVSIRKVF